MALYSHTLTASPCELVIATITTAMPAHVMQGSNVAIIPKTLA
jgi:hypothetical protein